MFSLPIKYLAAMIASFALSNGNAQTPIQTIEPKPIFQPIVMAKKNNGIINHNPKPQIWQEKLRQLSQGQKNTFRIIQLGDSHTAGGFFTDTVRQMVQAKWGNAGIGWVYPLPISGQRTSVVNYSGSLWQLLDSRKIAENYPLGGMIARSQPQKSLVLNVPSEASEQTVTLNMRPFSENNPLIIKDKNNKIIQAYGLHGKEWQNFQFTAQFPIEIQSNGQWDLGSLNIENGQSGIIVSALGVNGAQLSHWQKWGNWQKGLAETQADWVILAFGTNEAFNPQLNLAQTKQIWQDTIHNIQAALPNAAILIMGAPESLLSQDGECGVRPKYLTEIQKMQSDLAVENGLLFWSWQNAMGGECSMKNWGERKLAQKDGVHFTIQGYQQSARQFANDLIQLEN